MLRVFFKALFEPLDTFLQAISYKIFVLVALALGARRGELHAVRLAILFVQPSLVFCVVIF